MKIKMIISFFKRHPELLFLAAAILVWISSTPVLRFFDQTAGVFDAGIFQIPIFTVIEFCIYGLVAWFTLKIQYPTIRRYLQYEFKSDFNGLTPWQKAKLSFCVFFALVAALVFLATTLNA